MTREEEIINESTGRYPHNNDCCLAFIKGAKYADKTMLDRACEWLKENIDLYTFEGISIKSGYTEIKLTECFETAFRQAMEGE